MQARAAIQHRLRQRHIVALQQMFGADVLEMDETLFALEIGEQVLARLSPASGSIRWLPRAARRRGRRASPAIGLPRQQGRQVAVARRSEHGGANRLRRMAGDDLEFAAILQQFRQSLMDDLAGVVAEQFALLFFQFAARSSLLTAKQRQQTLGDFAPGRIVYVEIARNRCDRGRSERRPFCR